MASGCESAAPLPEVLACELAAWLPAELACGLPQTQAVEATQSVESPC